MVESVDTRDLKSLGVRAVRVQVPPGYHGKDKNKIKAISSVVKPPSGGFCIFFLISEDASEDDFSLDASSFIFSGHQLRALL